MLFELLAAKAKKDWKAATAAPIPNTATPIEYLTQRSAVELSSVPVILAQGNDSLFKAIPERNTVFQIGKLNYLGHIFYRIYLSQGEGAFFHFAVESNNPKKILESRLYRPYHQIVPLYQRFAAETETANDLLAPPGTDAEIVWTTWLLNDANPDVGGLIGCPTLYGKNSDIDPKTKNPYLYTRTWVPSNARIQPVSAREEILDADGVPSFIQYDMMHYGRPLADENQFEYLLVAATQADAQACVNYWLGIDITLDDLKIYPPPPPAT